ncbi:hypothetical protein MRB53_013853 [Persea americana]|uniref:Uncharacterized protein n=1 Tax=Persea americana TaxID=3435 RepID=A0ACC2K975_PERAE|nr:hypothetical protein MRB53_013853 [Persea americana]
MLISVRARRISRRKVAAHSAFSILFRDQEWLGRAVLLRRAGTHAELPCRAGTLDRAAELTGYDYRGRARGGRKLGDCIAGTATELERGLPTCGKELPGQRSFGSGGSLLGLVAIANVRSLSRCLFACPGYLIALRYRADGGTCRLFWLPRNYFKKTLGLRDGTLGLTEGTPLKGSFESRNDFSAPYKSGRLLRLHFLLPSSNFYCALQENFFNVRELPAILSVQSPFIGLLSVSLVFSFR